MSVPRSTTTLCPAEILESQYRKCQQALWRGNWALRNFTLQVTPGVLGLLGPNGAGKTTLMSTPHRYKIAIAGNHDRLFEQLKTSIRRSTMLRYATKTMSQFINLG